MSSLFANKSIKKEFITFICIGGISTAINYLVFFVMLTTFNLMYIIASTLGYLSGLIFSYFGNKVVTFKVSSNFKWKEFSLFVLVYGTSLGISLFLLHIFVSIVGIHVLIANFMVIAVSTMTNFAMLKLFLFKS